MGRRRPVRSRVLRSFGTREPYAAGLGVGALAVWVAWWVGRHSVCFEDAGVGVGLTGEQGSVPAWVVGGAGGGGGVPEPASEVSVCGGDELVAVRFVLADEQDEGRLAVLAEARDPTSSLSPGVAPTQHP